jgi:hypothetical protein
MAPRLHAGAAPDGCLRDHSAHPRRGYHTAPHEGQHQGGFFPRFPMICHRSPASSSFVLAAARLRALQLDPFRARRRDRAAARKIPDRQSEPQPGGTTQVTRLKPDALLTSVALMGAADGEELRRASSRCRARPATSPESTTGIFPGNP